MEEKIIVESKHYNAKRFGTLLIVAGCVLVLTTICISLFLLYFSWTHNTGANAIFPHFEKLSFSDYVFHYLFDEDYKDYMWFPSSVWLYMLFGLLLSVICIVIGIYSYISLSTIKLSVSTKRVFGNTSFNKRVDLPLDSISAVSTSLFKGVSISSASGVLKFSGIINRDEIYEAINKLLIERQTRPNAILTTIKQEIPQSNADELKKYKDLLDSGIITQAEFDAKKKQLLGL